MIQKLTVMVSWGEGERKEEGKEEKEKEKERERERERKEKTILSNTGDDTFLIQISI